MNSSLIFFLIVGIAVFEFLFSSYLAWLTSKSWKTTVPEALKEIYDEDKYSKAQEYSKANKQISRISRAIGFTGLILFLVFGGFAWLDDWVRSITDHPILMSLLFFWVLSIPNEIISIPFSLYRVFVIEERFGFNKMNLSTFILDKVKAYLLTGILGGGILSLIVLMYMKSGQWFWLYALLFMTAFSLFMSSFYTSILLPIFNKLSPLEDGPLRKQIEAYSSEVDFPLKNVFIMDASKRSSKANAFFSGIGGRKSIVLYDTLVKNYEQEELVAVLAHEVGHYKKKHVLKNQLISIVTSGIMFYLLGLALNTPAVSMALGAKIPSFHMGILAFGMLYGPISLLTGWIMNHISRKHEYEADAYAKATSSSVAMSNCLKKMSVDHLSNLEPHPLVVSVYYSHPPLLDRLKAMAD